MNLRFAVYIKYMGTNLGFEKTCQKCLKRVASTRSRQLYLKEYRGPCGDSFCYASCDMAACKPVDRTVCDECAKAIKKPGSS